MNEIHLELRSGKGLTTSLEISTSGTSIGFISGSCCNFAVMNTRRLRAAICQRSAFRKPLLKFAPSRRVRRFPAPLVFRCANWLDQNQLLHSFSRASQLLSPSQYNLQDAATRSAVRSEPINSLAQIVRCKREACCGGVQEWNRASVAQFQNGSGS
jgi:hypothetical protein